MIKVYIRQAWEFSGIEIVFIRKEEGSLKWWVAKPIKLEWTEHKEAEASPATLTLPKEVSDDFMKAMAEALDGQGIKTDNDHKIKGLLEAKEFHLQDMRKLVFENKTINN